MKTIELSNEELKTLIDALGTWMELPEEWEGEEWLRRQDRGGFLDMELRELLNLDDDWDGGNAESEFIQAGIDAREQVKATSRAATRRQQRLAKMSKGCQDSS